MTGHPVKRWHSNTPSDPDDFSRCYRLLLKFPEWRERLQEVADRFPEWKGMVDNWDELERLYLRDKPNCTEMYLLMQKLNGYDPKPGPQVRVRFE
jgi:hypothetical protein